MTKILLGDIALNDSTTMEQIESVAEFEEYKEDSFVELTSKRAINVFDVDFSVILKFKNNLLYEAELFPLNVGVSNPGYPSEEYQNAKWEICKHIIEKYFQDICQEENENGIVYSGKFEGGVIFCNLITGGRKMYEGGNLEIKMG